MMTLNKADVLRLAEVLDEFKIDHFKLIRHNESGIGYCLDVEYQTNLNDRMVTIRVPVCGVEDW
jgi:hypothetical protein